ncbi:hypothetical protein [Paenibacillus sp. P32E]|uniref:hypothetical protein n=1 Tax=Paenibacillus sp. P32E TaxID=1349434 RepID=UPI0009404CF7|nr:hypothetical protein [Paenibacillus sp. P32E]OKP93686.1 hypothetical protein A3848_04035 [Paenibacillus sp. P32E]
MPMSSIRRYDIPSIALSGLMQGISTALADDPFWSIQFLAGNGLGNGVTHGGIVFTNKNDPSMVITVGVCTPNTNYPSSLRFGLFKNATPKPDCFTNTTAVASLNAPYFGGWGGQYLDAGLGCYNSAGQSIISGTQKIVVVSHKEYVMILSEPITYPNVHYPIRLYLGRCKALETEDPAVANDFYGYFPQIPVGVNSTYQTNIPNYLNFGRGVVKYSRAKEAYQYYSFMPQSQQLSPGVGGAIFVSPFYVYNYNEGVRGEFYGMRTAVLKPSSLSSYPDGSIMNVGDDEYYVVHVSTAANINKASYGTWYSGSSSGMNAFPKFFDSPVLPNNGQRILLFKIN